ncbi:BrnA antitoxin family protein [Pseudomonas antarctica]|uniref:BrnA antitoxin family protein n=1 Tax=Pseudomonas antarctica TaxID=219572 RepID=UPI003F74E84D
MIASSRDLKSLVAVLVRQATIGPLNRSVPFFFDVLEWFRASGSGWQTRMNAALAD